MANFPSAPSNDDEHTIGSRTWVYDSSKVAWLRKAIIDLPAPAEPPPPPTDPAPEPSIDSFSPDSTSISEGQTVTFTVTTSNIPDGTVFNLSLVGTSSSADYPAAVQIGGDPVPSTITINSNTALFSITFKDDGLSEGIETLIATISGNVTFTDGTNTINRSLSETADTVSISDSPVIYTVTAPVSYWLSQIEYIPEDDSTDYQYTIYYQGSIVASGLGDLTSVLAGGFTYTRGAIEDSVTLGLTTEIYYSYTRA